MLIKVDDRERASGVIDALEKERNVEVEVARLRTGDYCIGDMWCVERKTLRDLALSIVDGRLFKQIYQLIESDYSPVLLLEGNSGMMREVGVSRQAIQGAITKISLFMRVPVIRSFCPEETAALLVNIGRQQQSLLDAASISSKFYLPVRNKPKGKYRQQLFILQSFPGIGCERARALLSHFGTVEKVLLATSGELAEIDGIGKKTAQQIEWAIREQSTDYVVGEADYANHLSPW